MLDEEEKIESEIISDTFSTLDSVICATKHGFSCCVSLILLKHAGSLTDIL